MSDDPELNGDGRRTVEVVEVHHYHEREPERMPRTNIGLISEAADRLAARGLQALGRALYPGWKRFDAWWQAQPLRRQTILFVVVFGSISLWILWVLFVDKPPHHAIQAPTATVSLAPADSAASGSASAPQAALPAAPATGSQPAAAQGPSDADIAQAKAVAGSFIVAYASWRFDDAYNAFVNRIRPYSTPELTDTMSHNSGATNLRASMAAVHEVATAKIQSATTNGLAADRIGLIVVADQTITQDTGTQHKFPMWFLTLDRTAAGWRVSDLQLPS